MGFAGQTYQVPCSKGGFTYNKNLDLVAPYMFVTPSRNINLHQNGRGKRGGTAKINGSALGVRILGLFDFRLPGISYQVFAGADGKIYRDTSTVLKTGMSATHKFNFAVFNAELYVCDGVSTVQTWDGSAGSTSDITTPAADWATTPPIQMVAHGRGASRRMWALAGNAVYYSSLGNGKQFSGDTSGKIAIDVQDPSGLTGGVEFGNRLIVFSRTQAYIIDDEDASTANWGYNAAQWSGGAAHWRGILLLENDVLVLAEDGQIYSITGAQQYGDYKIASLMRPSFIDTYLKDNVNVSKIDDFHLAYDRNLRAIKLFVVRAGQVVVDTALVLFIDRGPEEGWSIHDNQTAASGYGASCSTEVRISAGSYLIYTGDYSGYLWKLEQSVRADDSSGYYAGFKTPNLNLENSRLRKHFRQLLCLMEAEGNYSLQVSVWVDGVSQTGQTVSMAPAQVGLDAFILDTDTLGGYEFVDGRVALNYVGKRIQFEFYNSNANQNFFISSLLLDFKPLPSTV